MTTKFELKLAADGPGKKKQRAIGLPPGWLGNNQKAKYWGYWQLKGKGLRGYHSG